MPARTKAAPKKAAKNDEFVMTLDSDDEVAASSEGESDVADESAEEDVVETQEKGSKRKATLSSREKVVGSGKKAKGASKDDAKGPALDKSFLFDLGDGFQTDIAPESTGWDMTVNGGRDHRAGITVDDIIARRRKGLPEQIATRDDFSDDGEASGLAFTNFDDDEGDHEGEDEEANYSDEEDEGSDTDSLEFGAGVGNGVKSDPDEEESDIEDDDEDPLGDASGDEDQEGDDEEDVKSASAQGDSEDEETEVQKAKKAAFFAAESTGKDDKGADTGSDKTTFESLSLSRPIMRALATLNFHKPTPIQAKSIPIALAGKDIVAGAVTGSGKTAAFLIPILERLAHRPKGRDEAKTRVLILMPTRELAVQCISVGRALAKFMDIAFCLCVGGLSLKVQEQQLKERPDIVVATPGRLIDHVRNSYSFGIDDVEIMVMDEADRMLEEGFQAELDEIIKATPKSRQTMLFSATMTDDVDELVRLSMKRPVKLFVDPRRSTAQKLVQEFVRVRGAIGTANDDDDEGAPSEIKAGKRSQEETRMALLLSLCMRTFKHQVIIFVRSKKLAHQLRIIFGLLGLSAGELHGDLSQEQRLHSLQAFRDGKVDILLATDLASRGLDIKGVQTVINYDMPAQLDMYLHRVGRTARAGRNGRSVTLVGEADRKMLKTVLKRSPAAQIRHRLVPTETVAEMAARLATLKMDVSEVLKEEKEEKALRQVEMQVTKGENLIKHHDEIMGRPKRTWFVGADEKASHKNLAKLEYEAKMETAKAKPAKPGVVRDKYAGLSRKKRRSKMARDEMEAEGSGRGAIDASIRAAKKSFKPKELGVLDARPASTKDRRKAASKTVTAKKRSGGRKDGEEKVRSSSQKTGKKSALPPAKASNGDGGGGFKRDLGQRKRAEGEGGGRTGGGGGRGKPTHAKGSGKGGRR